MPTPRSYAQLVRRQLEHRLASADNREPFAISLEDSTMLCGDDIKGRLRGTILLNLGSGCRQDLLDPVEAFARQYGVSKVIHVDYRPSRAAQVDYGSSKVVQVKYGQSKASDHATRELTVAHVQKDMLAFLAKQPSRSMSVTINGIDDCVIEEEAYARAVGEEISRVVPVGGLAFGHCAWPLRYLKGFTPIREISERGGTQGMPSGYYLKTTVTGNTGVIPLGRAKAATPDEAPQTPSGQ